MRILHLETGRHLYGGARQVGYLIDALAARGHDNLLACARDSALAKTAKARVHALPIRGDLDLAFHGRLKRLIRDFDPDLVHAHSRRGADVFGGRAAAAAGVPALLTRRVQSREPAAWVRFKCKPYRCVVAISTAVRDELVGAGISERRLALITSAVDTERFRPDPAARARLLARYSLPPGAVLLGQAAQLIPRKGQDFAVDLVAGLIRDQPQLQFLVFGQGPDRARLERRVRTLGLERQIVFCGFEPDWPELLPGIDLLLHPARREGLGAVVLEAMSAGVVVVAAAVGGTVDVIEDGVDGRLLEPDARAAWEATIRDLLADAALRRRFGDAARRKVEARFTIDRMTDDYVSLYSEVLGRVGR